MSDENFVNGKKITFRWSSQINRIRAHGYGMQEHGVEFIVSPHNVSALFMFLPFEPLKRSELEH